MTPALSLMCTTAKSCLKNLKVNVANDDVKAETSPSPKRKPITFNINNTIAKPSNSPTLHVSKVTSRADSVADRKPYGHWVPISRSSSKK
ncbi:arginine/serine-rich protein 1-like isoform X2 [Sinocyclocheilus grahami]|uniref:arginine/serine-rich protein 1-like isoform X2 n=1 Tax=Sinocyclocheilus grahami TaxID=75366 RepID=UPI0007AD206E|nr:PREDICTED: arginine/serine-rich protein 1-like isoform X2 [Sinocyclocheilus grahami]